MTHSNRIRMSKLTLGLLAVLATAPVFAQSTSAGIGGRVVGADNQPVAGAEVTITHTDSGTVVVGGREALKRTSLTASEVNWIAGTPPDGPVRLTAQIRFRHREAHAQVAALEHGRASVIFDEPQSAVAPGQAVVFYDGDNVLGGGWIE